MRTIGRAFVLAVAFSVVTPVLPQSAHLASIKLEQAGGRMACVFELKSRTCLGSPSIYFEGRHRGTSPLQ
jgi:hypothetical protein